MLEYELEDLLVNWATWVRAPRTIGGPPQTKAISLESGYSNPQGKGCQTGWGDYYAGLSIPIKKHTFNLSEAAKIEYAMGQINPQSRTFFIFHYVYRADPRATCRKLRIKHITEYDQVWNDSKKELEIVLTSSYSSPKVTVTAKASIYSVGRTYYL